ncbi:transcription elongation factor A protein 1-like [Saccostrea echinata]|uniref:transcription elongation factor A protein 1-like n=1 Tax=Saccostrea echinata TaxID=191078 RepID=UPI002A82E2AD|nr:transcription elongation factor A protein 1-like [Saccostrea echinata]
MSCEDEVMKIGKKLEKMISNNSADHGGADDLLNRLKDIPMTLTVLQKTRIGMTVNNFRKAASKDEIVVLSKTLIKSWKKLLSTDSTPSKPEKREKEKEKSSGSPDQSDNNSEMSEAMDSQSSQGKTLMRQDSEASITNDPVRLKCRELLAAALKLDDDTHIPNAQSPLELGGKIEDVIYLEFKNTEQKYKARIRSRVANLKDKKNPKLKERVIMGLIPPESIAVMTADEMASDEMKQLRAKFTKESIDDHQMAKQEGTVTDLFKCGKCGKKNCTYNQLQTRSSDEPMTTFVFCMECGNRWKFC